MKNKREFIVENLAILVGTILLNLGFYFFFTPTNLVSGGVLGTSIILGKFGVPYWLTVLILNLFFLIIGFLVLGTKYGLRSIYASALGPTIVFILEKFVPDTFFIDHLTEAPLLISTVIGSIFTGLGLGIVFRNGGSTGGVDILQNIMHEKFHVGYQTAFIITDGIVIFIGLLVFRDLQVFLYAIGAVFLFSLIIDHLSIAGRAGHTLFIVTDKPEKMKEEIHEKLERGTTVLDVKGGYSDENKKLIICVINKRQLNYARHLIDKTDPNAFTFIAQTKEAVGLGFTRH